MRRESSCGALCSQCGQREQLGCPGCAEPTRQQGRPCAVRDCCRERRLDHCGQCDDFACEQLSGLQHGNSGWGLAEHITRCCRWAEQDEAEFAVVADLLGLL